MITYPKTLLEAINYYSSEVRCVEFISYIKWNGTQKSCPVCDSKNVYGLRTRPIFKCRDCKKQFSLKSGTIMEASPIPITKWVPAIWMICNCKNGISSCEVARALGVTQKTAWFMLHRIREAMKAGSMKKLSGTVEVDETYIGGKDTNRHSAKKQHKTGGADKIVVFGAVQRGGRVKARVISSHKVTELQSQVLSTVEQKSKLYSDEQYAYKTLSKLYEHDHVNHGEKEFVRGEVHSNSIENYWSLLKRTLKGTYIHVEEFHLDRYLDEQAFRYDYRKGSDASRFVEAISRIFGRRLTYEQLTGSSKR